ncbi:unnamed protein product [Camellia sinensis]
MEFGGEMKFDSSAWSRLHSTIANPLDFRPLASGNYTGANNKSFVGTTDCEETTSLGAFDHLH